MPKSKSGPGGSGQFSRAVADVQAMVKASSGVAWNDHASSPVSMSIAMIASLLAVVGRV